MISSFENIGRWKKSENPVILIVIRLRRYKNIMQYAWIQALIQKCLFSWSFLILWNISDKSTNRQECYFQPAAEWDVTVPLLQKVRDFHLKFDGGRPRTFCNPRCTQIEGKKPSFCYTDGIFSLKRFIMWSLHSGTEVQFLLRLFTFFYEPG
jgi:hypothetical protein